MRKILVLLTGFIVFSGNMLNAVSVVMPPASLPVSKPDSASVQSAVDEFWSLSSKERKARFKEVKKEIKNFKKAKRAGKETDTNTLLLVILAILLPPLAVYLYEGEINNRFWISLLLTLLGWLPGIIYALVLILSKN